MFNSGVFTDPSTDRIERNHILGIIVFDSGEVAKLPFEGIVGSEEIGHLNIYPLGSLGGNEVYLSGSKEADSDFKPLPTQMVPYDILHNLFNATPDIRTAKIVADTVVRKLVFIVRLKEHLAMDIKTPYRNCQKCVTKIFEIV